MPQKLPAQNQTHTPLIRDAQPHDFPSVLALNRESEHFLSPLNLPQLQTLHQQAAYHRVCQTENTVAAFLLAFREGAHYDSPNYRWFCERYPCFLYVDRVVVGVAYQSQRLGSALYREVFTFARDHAVPWVACEFDLEPPNLASQGFHARFGFAEVGTQWVACAKKKVSLQVNEQKSAVARPEDRQFVGFRLRRSPRTGEVEELLSARSKDRIEAKVRALTPRNWGQSLDDCIRRANRYLLGWIGFFRICSAAVQLQALRNLDAHLRRRLRAIELKQWRRRRSIAKNLIKLGANYTATWRQLYRGSISLWPLSHCAVVEHALNNRWCQQKGLKSLVVEWKARNSEHVVPVPAPTTE
ncbi:MAG: GNAT family N-acetyltransferase [Myxococcales bacterium]|nr:GNAT family N-acetyltransferase [Myxococcales bacterium]